MKEPYKTIFYKTISKNTENMLPSSIEQDYAEFVYCYDILQNIFHDKFKIIGFYPTSPAHDGFDLPWKPYLSIKANGILYVVTFSFESYTIYHTLTRFFVELHFQEYLNPKKSFLVKANPFDCSVDYKLTDNKLAEWIQNTSSWVDKFTKKYGKPPVDDYDVVASYITSQEE